MMMPFKTIYIISLLVLVFIPSSQLGADEDAITLHDVKVLNRFSSHQFEQGAMWSHEGRYLIYQVSDSGVAHETRVSEVSTEGNRLKIKKVSWADYEKEHPIKEKNIKAEALEKFRELPDLSFSPDQKTVAFVHHYRGVRNIAILPNNPATHSALGKVKDVAKIKGFRFLTTWSFDAHKPSWSPKGDTLAFYTTYNQAAKEGVWSIAAVPIDVEVPWKGLRLADRVLASDVVKDVDIGPSWSPNGDYIFFVSQKKIARVSDPIYATHVESGKTYWLNTSTRFNRSLRVSRSGILAFETQENGKTRIYLANTNISGVSDHPKHQ